MITGAWLLSLVLRAISGKGSLLRLDSKTWLFLSFHQLFLRSIELLGSPSPPRRPQTEGVEIERAPVGVRNSAGGLSRWEKCERGCWAWSESKRNQANEGDSIKGVRGLKNKEVLSPQQSGGRERHSDITQPKTHYCVKQVGSQQMILWANNTLILLFGLKSFDSGTVLVKKEKITSKDPLVLFHKPVLLLITHTAGWFLDLPHMHMQCIFIVQQSKLDIVYDAWYWKPTHSRGTGVPFVIWLNKLTNRLFVDARRRAAPQAQQRDIHSIFIPTTEVSEILMTLGRN